MWPKALLELLPHLTRLVPMLNRYFQSRGATDDATRLALERKLDEVSTALRKDIAEASAALPTADIARQLKDHGKSLSEIAAGTRAMQSQTETFATRLNALESRNGTLTALLAFTLVLTIAICILLIVILVKLHR